MATIVHFDIPVDNIERAKKFYEALFNEVQNGLPLVFEAKDMRSNPETIQFLGYSPIISIQEDQNADEIIATWRFLDIFISGFNRDSVTAWV